MSDVLTWRACCFHSPHSLKVLFMLLSGIALIRIVLVILIVLLMYTLCSLGTCCHDPKQPFSWYPT